MRIGKKFVQSAGTFLFTRFANSLPKKSAEQIDAMGRRYGNLLFKWVKSRRKSALENLRTAFGDTKTEAEIEKIARESFVSITSSMLDFCWARDKSDEEIDRMVEAENMEVFDRVLAGGKGFLLLTAHYGNWEMMARKIVARGYKLSVIARNAEDKNMRVAVNGIRENSGYHVFPKNESMSGPVKALRRNEVLGILPDQNTIDGVFVNFFGKRAKTATGPAVFHLKFGAPIVPCFTVKTGPGKYKMMCGEPLKYTPCGDYDKDVRDLTQLANDALEHQIRLMPQHWLWMHKRWKTQD